MSVNSQKQTYNQFIDWLRWFNRKYKRSENKSTRYKRYNK